MIAVTREVTGMAVQVPTQADHAAALRSISTLGTRVDQLAGDVAAADAAAGELRAALDGVNATLAGVLDRLGVLEGQPGPTPVPTPTPTPAGRRITRQGTRLYRGGQRYRFAGMNWDQAAGCGLPGSQPTRDQARRYFQELNPRSMTRIWVLPGMPYFQWDHYDMLVEEAGAADQHLCITLLNGQGDCTSRRASYETPVAADIARWVRDVVSRHAGDPTVAIVEPVNEADEGHPNIGAWYQAMAVLIKSVDPAVLVGTGGGNNSNDPAKIAAFAAGPALDLISYHDYYRPAGSRGPRAGIFADAARRANKPWYFGERGFSGPVGGGDTGSQDENGRLLTVEYRMALEDDLCAGYLYWDFKLVQPETSTARFDSGLWRAARDVRV